MNKLHRVILRKISVHLSWIEQYAFRLMNSYTNESTKDLQNITETINKRIQNMMPCPEKFISSLITNKCYLGGSFILQCLFGVEWPNSDIDIFTMKNSDPYSKMPRFIEDISNYDSQVTDYGYWDDGTWSRFVKIFRYLDTDLGHYCHLPIAACNLRYRREGTQMNYVHIKKYSSVFEFFKQTLDLDFTGVLFDGKKIYIKNLNSVMYKTCLVHIDNIQYIPYKKPNNEFFNIIDLSKAIDVRIEKYKERGFNATYSKKSIQLLNKLEKQITDDYNMFCEDSLESEIVHEINEFYDDYDEHIDDAIIKNKISIAYK